MNILKKTLSSLAIASFGLVMASSVWAETAAPSAEQPNVVEKKAPTKEELAPANKDLKIESSNEKFAEKYPNQYNSWKDTSKSTEAAPAVEQDPRLIVLWGGYAFAKEYNKPRGHFYSVTDVRNILRTGAPKLNDENSGPQPMAC